MTLPWGPEKPGGPTEKENPKLRDTTSEEGTCPLLGDKTDSNAVIWLTSPSAWGRLRNCPLSHTRIHEQSLLSLKWDTGQKPLSLHSPSAHFPRVPFGLSPSVHLVLMPCLSVFTTLYKPQTDSWSRFCNSTWWEPSKIFECSSPFLEGSWVSI